MLYSFTKSKQSFYAFGKLFSQLFFVGMGVMLFYSFLYLFNQESPILPGLFRKNLLSLWYDTEPNLTYW
jgi:hypothetical protein